MICLECGKNPAVPVPRHLLPICLDCARRLGQTPWAPEAVLQVDLRQHRRGQLGLLGQVEQKQPRPRPAREQDPGFREQDAPGCPLALAWR